MVCNSFVCHYLWYSLFKRCAYIYLWGMLLIIILIKICVFLSSLPVYLSLFFVKKNVFDLEIVTLHESSEAQKILLLTPFILNVKNKLIHREKIQTGYCQSLAREEWKVSVNRHEVSFLQWNYIVMIAILNICITLWVNWTVLSCTLWKSKAYGEVSYTQFYMIQKIVIPFFIQNNIC
jgi:hypothetical protein